MARRRVMAVVLSNVLVVLARTVHFCRLFDEQVSFRTNSHAIATALVYTQHGKRRLAQRLK
jgi:hypothetical protein